VAFDYLPGSVLRGMVISLYRHHYGLPEDFSTDPTTRRLFLEPSIRYLNAYPFDGITRALPTPISWQHPKDFLNPIVDYAISPDSKTDHTSLKYPFCTIDGESLSLCEPIRILNVHINRENRRAGRPTISGEGTVYRYEALASGQTFEAFILCEDDQAAATLEKLLVGTAKIGGAKSVNYGRVRLETVPDSSSNWRECGGELQFNDDAPIILTCLSPAILRDRHGQYAADRDTIADALEPYLGKVVIENAFLRSTLIGGFNARWGLPIPQTLAVSMGSVLVISGEGVIPKQLTQLEQSGIGERRAEGFGRIAVNWQRTGEYANAIEIMLDRPSGVVTLTAESTALVERMAKRLLQREVEQRIWSRANQVSIKKPPTRSQIYQLRQKVAEGLSGSSPSLKPLENHISSIEARQVARRAFGSAYVDGLPFLTWLKQYGNFNLANLSQTIAGKNIILSEDEQTVAKLRYMDAVLGRVAKQERNGAE
jgi:CRISPR-associated protein Csx10